MVLIPRHLKIYMIDFVIETKVWGNKPLILLSTVMDKMLAKQCKTALSRFLGKVKEFLILLFLSSMKTFLTLMELQIKN